MLYQLTINNYAIVEHLNLELKPGMSVITGETGAGKSIMIDALGLALGDRADRVVIRPGSKRADISACFSIEGNKHAKKWLISHDLDENSSSECILRRIVTIEGRSKAYINGQPSPLSELKELGETLIDIHSQHEHQSLLKTSTHQRLLDEYCGLTLQVSQLAETSSQWRKLNQQLEETQNNAEENNAQFQLISYQAKELDELNLEPNELESLESEHTLLSHAEESLAASHQALSICQEDEQHNILSSLNKVINLLHTIPNIANHTGEAEKLLTTALIQVEEAAGELSNSIDRFDLNPARLEDVNQRLSNIHQMARKHKTPPKELYPHYQDLKAQLKNMSRSDIVAEALQIELDALQSTYQKASSSLSRQRKKGSLKLEKEINQQLTALGMSTARFSIALNTQKNLAPQPKGFESIEFLISTNPGQDPKAMIKIASGGELSRISLAIQVATAQTSGIPTLVFDEVDVGIGGSTAKVVGSLLRQLGEKGQVLCVTHQAQVASQGHQHLYVSKQTSKSTTTSKINELSSTHRIEEIARMLGGDELSESSLAHAKELII